MIWPLRAKILRWLCLCNALTNSPFQRRFTCGLIGWSFVDNLISLLPSVFYLCSPWCRSLRCEMERVRLVVGCLRCCFSNTKGVSNEVRLKRVSSIRRAMGWSSSWEATWLCATSYSGFIGYHNPLPTAVCNDFSHARSMRELCLVGWYDSIADSQWAEPYFWTSSCTELSCCCCSLVMSIRQPCSLGRSNTGLAEQLINRCWWMKCCSPMMVTGLASTIIRANRVSAFWVVPANTLQELSAIEVGFSTNRTCPN